jgi:hypothetical protein
MTVFSPSGSTYLRLVGWDGAKWVNLSTVTHATGTAENSLLYGRVVPGITALGIGKGLAPLPVTLEYFNGTANGCSAVLTWKTAVEENVKHFEVQYSLNGKDFHTVGQVAAGAATKTYSYTNEQNGGTGYYQLKTVDANGTYGYSPVVSVQTTCAETNVVVFPNPVKDYVKIKGVQAGTSIYVVNTAGQTVLRTTASDSGVQLLNTQRLAPGAYIIVTEKNNQRQQFKIVKQAN